MVLRCQLTAALAVIMSTAHLRLASARQVYKRSEGGNACSYSYYANTGWMFRPRGSVSHAPNAPHFAGPTLIPVGAC